MVNVLLAQELASYSPKALNNDHNIENVLTSLEINEHDIEEFRIIDTDNYEIVIVSVNTSGLYSEFYVLELPGIVLPERYTLKLEYEDILGDFDKELIIWWSCQDSNNGSEEGFENEVNGVTVIDNINNFHVALQLEYLTYYTSYMLNSESAVNEECSCFIDYDFFTTKNKLILSNYKERILNSKGCKSNVFTEGTYFYSSISKKLELKQ